MSKSFASLLAVSTVALSLGLASSASAQMPMSDPMVGGAAMYPSKTIVENAVNSPDHTTLVAAVKAAGLVDTLSGPGPFTRVRAHQRGLRQAAGRYGGDPGEA